MMQYILILQILVLREQLWVGIKRWQNLSPFSVCASLQVILSVNRMHDVDSFRSLLSRGAWWYGWCRSNVSDVGTPHSLLLPWQNAISFVTVKWLEIDSNANYIKPFLIYRWFYYILLLRAIFPFCVFWIVEFRWNAYWN